MTVIFSDAARRATSGGLGGFVRWIGVCTYALAARWERRAAISALRKRDDRELRDIGLAGPPTRKPNRHFSRAEAQIGTVR